MQNHSSHINLRVAVRGFVLLLFAASPVISLTQTQNYAEWHNGVTERWFVDLSTFKKQDLNAAIERWKLIESEIQNPGSNQWAGSYFTGSDTHGTYLRWSPDAGFVMAHVNKCAATLMGLSFGKVSVSPTSMKFIFEYQNLSHSHTHKKSHTSVPSTIKFVPARWGNDQYLIRENEMADFGNYVAGFGRYNQEYMWVEGLEFFTRHLDKDQNHYEGLPQVPAGYEKFLKRPIDAEITSLGPSRLKRSRDFAGQWHYERHTPVTVNAGALDGVKRGMFFRVLSSDQGDMVKIIRVGKRSSEGVIVRWVDDNKQEHERYAPIEVGWLLSTSMHKLLLSDAR